MLMQEHEDNLFTKEKSEIERYLLRIIQRYFEIENVNSQISVENIIVESIRRIKEDIFDERGFIFSFNEKTGHVTLTIQVFGGEYAFEKRTAFNKDFGEQVDTICEGNDKRLSNKRQPLDHIHDIGDVTDLKERLQAFLIQLQEVHYHRNSTVLDKLIYSGIQTEIDLIVIDDLLGKVNTYYTSLNQVNLELKAGHNSDKDTLNRALIATKNNLTSVKDFINQSFIWINAVKAEINRRVMSYKQDNLDLLAPKLDFNDVNNLVDYFDNVYQMCDSGERNIVSMYTSFTQSPGYTKIINTNLITQIMQGKAKLYFRYEKNSRTVTIPLPYIMKVPNGFCCIQGGQEIGSNEIYIETKMITTVNNNIDASNIYQDNTVVFASSETVKASSILNKVKNNKMSLPIMTDVMKVFMVSLITDNELYLINAFKDPTEDIWYTSNQDGTQTQLPYTVDDFTETSGKFICLDKNGELHRVNGDTFVKYIAEYEIPNFFDYFESPRIYYQVYKEGI